MVIEDDPTDATAGSTDATADPVDAAEGSTETAEPAGRSRCAARSTRRTALFSAVLVIVLIALGGAGGVVFTSLQPTLYASKALVRVYDPTTVPGTTAGRVDPTRLVAVEVSYAESGDVSRSARAQLAKLHSTYDRVAWSGVAGQDSVSAVCYAATPATARVCAGRFAAAYITLRRTNAPQALLQAALEVDREVTVLQTRAGKLATALNSANPTTSRFKQLLGQQTSLLTQVNALIDQASASRAQAAAIGSNFRLVQPATLPHVKFSPTPTRNLTVGLLAGLLLGVAAVLLLYQLRATRRARHSGGDREVERR